MKKFLLFVFAALTFAACEQAPIEEMQGVAMSDRSLEVSFEGADDTRIQLQGGKTVWTEGDHVSVFYRSTTNEEWQFMGKTGDRTGQIVPVDNSVNPPATHNRVVVIYPYNKEYYLNTEKYSIEASLPAVQNYLEDSYGTNGNIMVSSNDYKQVSLKSVCGWLKLQLTGDGEVVKSITFKGNNGEQVAGELHINTSDATCVLASASGDAGESEVGGTLVRPGTILTEVTLDCGDGVTLGAETTAFYIALPPQTFENGFTVEIEDTEGYVMEQSTDKALTIERNTIKPMASIEFTPSVPNNQIWYTSSDGNVVTPRDSVFGANIISNTYSDGMGVITFDGDVTTIGDSAFFHRYSLTSVTIPDSVTSIGDSTFNNCISLRNVDIPNSVTSIGSYAFHGCDSLTSVTIPESVTSIGVKVFASCSKLKEFHGKYATDSGRCLIKDNTIIAYAEASGTTYTIPNTVNTIGDGAFFQCHSIRSVTIPDSITTIEVEAFGSCSKLEEFNGKYAVDGGRCLIKDNTLITYAEASGTTYTIPDSVTTIGEYAFHYCNSLISVTIPDSVTTIGKSAFQDCTSLTSVTIGNNVTTIRNFAFYSCGSLTSVTIGNSVTKIENSAFGYCDRLTSVTIPDSVTEIGYGVFRSCESLTSVYCKATTPPSLGTDVFYSNGNDRMIYAPTESVQAYKSATNWSKYASAIVGYDFENGVVVE